MSRRFEIYGDHDDYRLSHLHRRIDRRGGGGSINLSGRRAIVTGGASGIGIETAQALAGAGAEVTLAVRNVEAGNRTAEDIAATTGNARVGSPRWTWPIELLWHRSSPLGTARCTSWSTTPA